MIFLWDKILQNKFLLNIFVTQISFTKNSTLRRNKNHKRKIWLLLYNNMMTILHEMSRKTKTNFFIFLHWLSQFTKSMGPNPKFQIEFGSGSANIECRSTTPGVILDYHIPALWVIVAGIATRAWGRARLVKSAALLQPSENCCSRRRPQRNTHTCTHTAQELGTGYENLDTVGEWQLNFWEYRY